MTCNFVLIAAHAAQALHHALKVLEHLLRGMM